MLVAVLACGGPLPSSAPTSRSPGTSPAFSPTSGLHDYWWFEIHWSAEQRPGAKPDVAWEPITSATLAMGRLDGEPIGETLRTFLDPKPFVSFRSLEPFAHRIGRDGVAFGYFDGVRSRVESVDAESGESEVMFESERPVHNAVVSRDRNTLYAVLLDSLARTEAGVWAFDLASGDKEGHMLLPATRFDPEKGGLIEELYLIPDGSSLVVRDCYRECRVRVVDLANGKVRTLAQKLPAGTSAYGVTDQKIVFDANCELPCPLLALDLRTGQQSPVGWGCSTAIVIDSNEGPLVVADGHADSCRGGLRVVLSLMDPVTEPVQIFETDVADAALVRLGDQFDALMPMGSFLVAAGSTPVGEQPRGFPLLIDAISRSTIPLVELRSK
jgi:hypothetical protein